MPRKATQSQGRKRPRAPDPKQANKVKQLMFSGCIRDMDVRPKHFLPEGEEYRWLLCVSYTLPGSFEGYTCYQGCIFLEQEKKRPTAMARKYPHFKWVASQRWFSDLMKSFDNMEQDYGGHLIQRGKPHNYHKKVPSSVQVVSDDGPVCVYSTNTRDPASGQVVSDETIPVEVWAKCPGGSAERFKEEVKEIIPVVISAALADMAICSTPEHL